MKAQLQFLIDGSEVSRYHTVRTLQSETVGHHSHGVALLCQMIWPECPKDLLIMALTHDLAEHRTGDIPAPAKKEYKIGDMVNELEEKLLKSVGFDVLMTDKCKRVLKLADIFQGMIFCAREIQLGNKRQEIIMKRYEGYAEAFVLVGREAELFKFIKELTWAQLV